PARSSPAHYSGRPGAGSGHDRFAPMAIDAGVGLSIDEQPERAAREAASAALDGLGSARADWGVVFITSPHRPHVAVMRAAIQKVLGTEFVTGCSAWGVLTGAQEVEGKRAVAVLAVRSDSLVASTFLAALGEDDLEAAAREVARQARASADG